MTGKVKYKMSEESTKRERLKVGAVCEYVRLYFYDCRECEREIV